MQTLAFSRLPPQQLVLVLALWPLLPELETALLTTSASLSGPSLAPRGGRASWNPGEGPRHAAEVLGVCPGPLTRPRHWACARAPSPGQGARRVPGRPPLILRGGLCLQRRIQSPDMPVSHELWPNPPPALQTGSGGPPCNPPLYNSVPSPPCFLERSSPVKLGACLNPEPFRK